MHSKFPDIVELLLRHSANPNIPEKEQQNTPLHLAASKGYKDSFLLLLNYGASPSALNLSNNTPLHLCCYSLRDSFIKILLSGDHISKTEKALVQRNTKMMNPLNILRSLIEKNNPSASPTSNNKDTTKNPNKNNKNMRALLKFVERHYSRYLTNQLNPLLMEYWSVEDVANWLDLIHLGQYAEARFSSSRN